MSDNADAAPQWRRMDATNVPSPLITWDEIETAELKRQSRAMGQKLLAQNLPVEVFESPDRNYFDVVHDMSAPETRLGQSIRALLSIE